MYSCFVERLLDDASRALEEVSGRPVERHQTGFGVVLAAPVDEARLIAFAVSREWPCPILEVDWIDRVRKTAEPITIPLPASLRVPTEIASLYQTARRLKVETERDADVDPGAA